MTTSRAPLGRHQRILLALAAIGVAAAAGSVVPAPAGLTPLVEIRALAVPAKQKQTRLIPGTAPEAAKALVRALREDARVLEGA